LELGISVYTSDEYTYEKNMKYIQMAKNLGVPNVFTSFNISSSKKEIEKTIDLIRYIKKEGLHTSVDVSSQIFKRFNAKIDNLSVFYDMGIDEIRIDYGFSAEDIAYMSNNNMGISIVINASTSDSSYMEEILRYGGNMTNIGACHNFYPRRYTGLSHSFYNAKNDMLKEYGLEISSFIPSDTGRRGPLYEGLPTLEEHRKMPSYAAAKDLIYGSMTDRLYLGDAYASKQEIEDILGIDKETVELGVHLFDGVSCEERQIIFKDCHTNRRDASEYLVRSVEARVDNTSNIESFNCIDRKYGSITIDNINMGRYMGELQIVRTALPADPRVNVVGRVAESDIRCLKYIHPGKKFALIEEDR